MTVVRRTFGSSRDERRGPTPTARLVRLQLRKLGDALGARSTGWSGVPTLAGWKLTANVAMTLGRIEIATVERATLDEALRALLAELFLVGEL